MRILLVIDNLSTGGAQRQMVNLAIGLRQRDHTVEIFSYAPGDMLAKPLYDQGIRVHFQMKRSRFSLDVIKALTALINEQRYDLVLSFLTTPNFYSISAGRLSRHAIPVIVSERFCDLAQGIGRIDALVRQFYRLASHVVVNSHHQNQNFSARYPWLRKKISTIYNGYDLDFFSPAAVEPDNHPPKILTIASVGPYKNGLCLVEALHILRTEHQFFPIVEWIGQHVYEGEYGKYLVEMQAKIREYGLEKDWHWLGQRTDVVDQLHAHDVLVHPSYGEGLPNVVCEALACARPVIVSDVLDHPVLVQENKSGYLFDWKDPRDLAGKIMNFFALPVHVRRQMGRHGRRYAKENLSLARFIDDYENLFAAVLGT